MTIGSTGDRFSAMFGAAYVKEEPVMAGDRAISAEPVYGTGVAFGSSTTPFGRFEICNTATPVTNPASCPTANRRRPDGTAGQFTLATSDTDSVIGYSQDEFTIAASTTDFIRVRMRVGTVAAAGA